MCGVVNSGKRVLKSFKKCSVNIYYYKTFNMFRADRGRKHLNDQERAAIIAFTEAGKTVADISERLGIGAATVSLWQNRFRETGSIIRKQGSGRPKKLTPENEEDIVLAVSAKPITTAQEIAGNLFDQISLVPFFYI